jgi:hypothetical protein
MKPTPKLNLTKETLLTLSALENVQGGVYTVPVHTPTMAPCKPPITFNASCVLCH